MPEKQQIMPVSLAASCETYNCYKKIAWAIGRPDGPRQLWNYYCDDCMRDVVATIPAELLPESIDQDDINTVNGYIALTLEAATEVAESLPDGELKTRLLTEIKATQTDVEQAKDQEPPAKTYVCKYCGEPFDSPGALGNHVRRCQAKKEVVNG